MYFLPCMYRALFLNIQGSYPIYTGLFSYIHKESFLYTQGSFPTYTRLVSYIRRAIFLHTLGSFPTYFGLLSCTHRARFLRSQGPFPILFSNGRRSLLIHTQFSFPTYIGLRSYIHRARLLRLQGSFPRYMGLFSYIHRAHYDQRALSLHIQGFFLQNCGRMCIYGFFFVCWSRCMGLFSCMRARNTPMSIPIITLDASPTFNLHIGRFPHEYIWLFSCIYRDLSLCTQGSFLCT